MSTTFEITGKLIGKYDEQQISEKFKKREFVIEVENERNSDWNDHIKFQLTQNNCEKIEDFSLNSEIKVSFNIRGRRFEKDGKVNYFTNLEAWRIDKSRSDDTPQHQEVLPASNGISPNTEFDNGVEETDDLPF